MKASTLFLGAILLMSAVALAQQNMGAIRPDEVGEDQVGKKVAVEGRVFSNTKTPVGIHLYFGPDTTTAFQAVVPSRAIYKFHVDVTKRYDKRDVRVTGKVQEENGRLFILIEDPSQIKALPHKR